MHQQDQFVNITHLFYSGQYSQGLKEISKIIKRQSNNSNLYVNRALFLSQLGSDDQAIRDIERALAINPRNYIAYFNLFSIQTKLVEDEDALNNLCCSLSCLYLIRGKLTKALEDVETAIRYSYNNHEAHVLKGLLLMQKQLYAQSMKSFQNAHKIDPANPIINNLLRIAAENGHLSYELPTENGQSKVLTNYRLKSSFKIIDGVELFDQIDRKLVQFNNLYVDINENAGAITQKVPKESILSPEDNQGRHSRNQQIKIIYDSGLSTPVRQSEVHPEPGNAYIKSSILHQSQQRQFHQCTQNANFEEQNFISIINQEENIEQTQESFQPLEQNKGSIIQDEFSSVLNIDVPLQEIKEPFERLIEPESMNLPLDQKIEEIQQSQPIEHYNLIYPIDDHMKLKIKILNLEFIEKDEEFLSKLTDIYCIINYCSGKTKLKTLCKSCEDGVCTWNQEFEPIDITETPSDMKIKIYNKKYKSVRDDFLGDLEVLITTADLLKLPLYNKSGILGNLLMHLQLVEVVPPPRAVQPSDSEEGL